MDNKVIANLKSLSIDMIDKAQSGHPGIALSSAPIIYTLYANYMNINIKNNDWINRDRFIMSAGHGSALLYATLYMCGFLSIDDLKAFRQLGSKTTGHPEITTPGVDMSTGPLGQGLASGVGMAMGLKHRKETLKNLIDNYVYVLCSDGDLMEGVSYEACSLAGTLNLNNLIVLYDSNNISLDGSTMHTFTENVLERFNSMNWFTLTTSNKYTDIDRAINKAKKSGKPSLIEVKTIIGDGSTCENTNKVHGKPLTKEDIKQLKEKLNIPNIPFYVDETAKKYFVNKIIKRSSSKYIKWNKEYSDYILNNLDSDIKLKKFDKKIVDFNLEDNPFDINNKEEIRESNYKIMNLISEKTDLLFGGSADLSSSCKTYLTDEGDFSKDNYGGKNIWYGVREHAMGAISNGLALTGYLPFCSTFLTFLDYLKPAIRMSALMNVPVTYIFTHDSISVGEDGPTHQPIEQLSSLRSIPNLIVYRPSDYNEVLGAWNAILKLKKPSALVISKNKARNDKNTNANNVIKGAYIIKEEQEKLDAIFVSTGDNIDVTLSLAEDISKNIRVVSMPSVELFLMQEKQYQYSVLPVGVKTLFIEASNDLSLRRFVSNSKYLILLNNFGQSGKKDAVLKYNGFDKESIKKKIQDLL